MKRANGWVLCSDSTGKFVRADVHPVLFVDDPFAATIYDERDNPAIKVPLMSGICGQKLVAVDL